MNKKFLAIYFLLSASYAQAQNIGYDDDNGSFLPEHFFSYLVTFLSGCVITAIIMIMLKPKKKSRDYYRNSSSYTQNNPVNNHVDFNRVKNTVYRSIERQAEHQLPVEPPLFLEEDSRNVVFENIDNTITKQPIAESPIMYFPNPNVEGNFRKVDGRGVFLEGASIYKFNLVSPTEAEFEFCKERSSVSIALNNRNELILNVADELNAYNSKASQILSDSKEKGTALLDGTVWKVTKKAKIKYI